MNKKGFTLIEILIAISLMAIIGTFAFIAMNPGGQIAKARNSQRTADLNTIMNGVRQNIAENRTGSFTCATGALPTSTALKMASTGSSTYDIADCVLIYINIVPHDPAASGAHYTSVSDYDSGYFIQQNSTTKQVTLSAPSAELGKVITITR